MDFHAISDGRTITDETGRVQKNPCIIFYKTRLLPPSMSTISLPEQLIIIGRVNDFLNSVPSLDRVDLIGPPSLPLSRSESGKYQVIT